MSPYRDQYCELRPTGWTGLRCFELANDEMASIELIESEAE
jgi:hypothetical protein